MRKREFDNLSLCSCAPNFSPQFCQNQATMRGKSEHRELRDEALYEAYKKIRSTFPMLSFDEQIEKALTAKQPRMWVSFYGVYRILLKIIAQKSVTYKKNTRNSLAHDIETKYRRLLASPYMKNASAYFLTSFIIAEPSSGFYVSHSYAKRIIFNTIRKKQLIRNAK